MLLFVFLILAEARKQVMEATERLGGQYSPNLHPQCTHLVVQISLYVQLINLFSLLFSLVEEDRLIM